MIRSRPIRQTADALVGQYFTVHGDHDALQSSGTIQARMTEGRYLVVYHDALMLIMAGIPSEHHREVVPLDHMVGWRFYGDLDTFALAYTNAVERDRQREAL
jgi:hypothetical protein